MIMIKIELKNNFQTSVSSVLLKYNFKLNKQTGEFTKKTAYGWDKFHLIFTNKWNGWEIDFGMLIRIDVIENIYHKGSYYEKKYHKTTPTVGITIEDYLNNGEEYKMQLNELNIYECFVETVELFENIALPFFQKYHSIENLDKAINMDSGNSIFSGIKYEGNLGIILAGITGNSNFNLLERKYRDYYTNTYKGFYLQEFENILKEIKTQV